MKRITWILVTLALALTASLVVAKTWTERLERQRLAEASMRAARPGDAALSASAWSSASDNLSPAWADTEPGPPAPPAPPAAQQVPDAPEPLPAAAAARTPAASPRWTVKVVRGQRVEEVHYRNAGINGRVD